MVVSGLPKRNQTLKSPEETLTRSTRRSSSTPFDLKCRPSNDSKVQVQDVPPRMVDSTFSISNVDTEESGPSLSVEHTMYTQETEGDEDYQDSGHTRTIRTSWSFVLRPLT